jgi:hypothetical protein
MNLRARLATALLLVPVGPLAAQQATEGRPSEVELADSTGRPRVRVRETIIGFNDPNMNEESFVSSPDGKRVAYMVMAGEGLAVVVDGEKGEAFEGIAANSIVFSPDGKHLGYVGTRPGKQYVVLDGRVHEYTGVSKQGIVFSPDGAHHGWVALRADRTQIAVVDGVESAPYEDIAAQGIVFSPDGRRHGFIASSAGKFLVVIDGEEGPLFDSVASLRFTAAGRALYVALREGKWFAVVDGVPHGPYDELRSLSRPSGDEDPAPTVEAFEVSADGSRVGFVAKRGEEWFAVVDGEEHGPYERCVGLALSPEGSRMAFLASRGDGWFMVVDGEERPGNTLESLSFSPDGKRLGTVARRGEKRFAAIDGVEGKEYDRIDEPGVRFSPDGQHTAYVAEVGGEKLVVIDGVESPRFKRLGRTSLTWIPNGSRPFYSISKGSKLEALVVGAAEGPAVKGYRSLVFSPDGSRYAYIAEKETGGFVVVLDGVEYGPGGKLEPGSTRAYPKVAKGAPTFSADGKRVAWVAVGEKGFVVVVDGKESRPYNVVMRSTVDFTPDGAHVVFVASRDGQNMIVVDDFEIANGWDPPLQRSRFVWEDDRRFSILGSRNPRYLLIEVEIL